MYIRVGLASALIVPSFPVRGQRSFTRPYSKDLSPLEQGRMAWVQQGPGFAHANFCATSRRTDPARKVMMGRPSCRQMGHPRRKPGAPTGRMCRVTFEGFLGAAYLAPPGTAEKKYIQDGGRTRNELEDLIDRWRCFLAQKDGQRQDMTGQAGPFKQHLTTFFQGTCIE